MKQSGLLRKTPMKRSAVAIKPRRRSPNADPDRDTKYLKACRGQQCFLAIPGICRGEVETIVPCHANWGAYGKGLGLKAKHIYTVPGCMRCHYELDQGFSLTKEVKRATWEWAYTRWVGVRDKDSTCEA